MKTVRVALIGAGGMANRVHYPSLADFEDVELVGLCDLDAGKLSATAGKFGIKDTFSDYGKMLDATRPDAVYALMPPHVLFDVAMTVMDAGYNLFVEKPPAVTTHQAACLARKAGDKRLITGVGFQRRYHPLAVRCLEEVRKAGQPHQVVSHFLKHTDVDGNYPYYRGAIDLLRCDAIHAVDALRFYCGLSEVKAVASEVRNLDAWYPLSFNALVHFANDTIGILHLNWRTGKRFMKFEFHAAGSSAYVDADGSGEVWVNNGAEPAFKSTCTEVVNTGEERIAQGFQAQSRAFIDAVKSGTPLHNSLQDSVKSMELCDLIYRNAINK